MNKYNILRVAKVLERKDYPFDFISWPFCITGLVWRINHGSINLDSKEICDFAAQFFELDCKVITELSVASQLPAGMAMAINRQVAIKCLKHLANTGEVDWRRALEVVTNEKPCYRQS